MDIFVKKNDKLDVEVYAYDDADGNVDATHEKDQVPKDAESVQVINFVFRRPSYEDSIAITKFSKGEGEMMFDVMNLQEAVLHNLCVDWDIKGVDDKKITVSRQNKYNLQPSIARAAVNGCLSKIKI